MHIPVSVSSLQHVYSWLSSITMQKKKVHDGWRDWIGNGFLKVWELWIGARILNTTMASRVYLDFLSLGGRMKFDIIFKFHLLIHQIIHQIQIILSDNSDNSSSDNFFPSRTICEHYLKMIKIFMNMTWKKNYIRKNVWKYMYSKFSKIYVEFFYSKFCLKHKFANNENFLTK